MIEDGYRPSKQGSLTPAAMAFMRDHGVLKDIYSESSGSSHKTARGSKVNVRTVKAPGFGPRGVLRCVLPFTVFLKLKDIGGNVLPPYNEEFRDVAIHVKGSVGSFRPIDEKPSLTLAFSKFDAKRTFHGTTKIHFNNSVEDPTYLHENLGSLIFSKAGIAISQDRPTTVKTRVIASHQHVVRVDEESDAPLTDREELEMLERIQKVLPQCQVVIFEDYDKGAINPSIIEKTVALSGKLNIPTVVDPKKRNFLAYKNVTLFKPNLKELREGLKTEVAASNQTQVEQATATLRGKLQARGVMLTLSEHGVYIDFENQKIKLSAHQRKIVDVSGAGDTVVSVAALCTAMKLDAKTIASLSNLAGGLVCQHVGVVPIDKNELMLEATRELPI